MLIQITLIFCIISLNNICLVSADIKGDPNLAPNARSRRAEGGIYESLKALFSTLKCGTKLLLEFSGCQSEANAYWKDVDNYERVKCCGYFDVTYCLIKKAKEKCEPEVYEDIAKKAREQMDKSAEEECKNYGHRWYDWKSFKCHIPWLAVAIVIAVTVSLIIVGICLCRLL